MKESILKEFFRILTVKSIKNIYFFIIVFAFKFLMLYDS